MSEYRAGKIMDDLTLTQCYDGSNWRVHCVCGRDEAVNIQSLIALQNLGMHIACSKCRVQRPFKSATPIAIPPANSPELPFEWSDTEE